MRLSDLTGTTADALKGAGAALLDLMTPTLRLGVTGLARSGKTVFITALVRSLVAGGRLPFFAAMAEGRVARAYLEPQPDDAVPRFAYEEHLAQLASDPPQWPESTKRISQLRVTIEYAHTSALRRALGPGRLHVDIVDYPGEWLIDLPLLEMSFADWSRRAVEDARAPHRAEAAKDWLQFLSTLDPDAAADEQAALTGAGLFTRYLQAARAPDPELTAPGPGRFLLPGDLAGSPLLTFFPLPPAGGSAYQRGSLGAMLARRFESYKAHVVKPFFRDHFARLDRQIVLIDALSAVNAGAGALGDLQRTMEAVLEMLPPRRQHLALRHPGAAHRPPAVRRHQGRPSAPHQPRPARGHPAPHRRQGHGARGLCRRRGQGDGARGAQGHARGGGQIGAAAAALHRRRAAAGRASGRQGVRRQGGGGGIPGRPAGGPGEPAGPSPPSPPPTASISCASGRRG